MFNVSENAAAVINSDGRTFKARITVDGQVITDSIKRILFTYGTCGASAFAFGSVFKSCAEIILSELGFSITDKEMLIEVGPVLPDGSVEYISMGHFKATKPNIKVERDKVEIKAYDRLENNGSYVPTVEFPTTIQSVIDDISSQMGVSIITDLDTSGIVEKLISSGTYISVLQVIAGLLGGVVVCDRNGKIVITSHPTEASAAVNEERCLRPIESSDDKYTIETLTVIASAGGTDALGEEEEEISYTYGSGYGISVENEYMTEAMFEAMKNRIVGYSFDSCSLKFMGDPRIEAIDALEVTNWAGEVFFVPCMSLVHEFDGGFSTEVSTPSIATGESGTVGPLQQTVNNLVHDMVLAKKVIAKQITADRIDVDDLFAQDIKATGTITGANFIGATGSFEGMITTKSGIIGGWIINEFSISSSNEGDMYTEEGINTASLNLGYIEFASAYTVDSRTQESAASLDGKGVKAVRVSGNTGSEYKMELNAEQLYFECDPGWGIKGYGQFCESGYYGIYDDTAESGYLYRVNVGKEGIDLREINPNTGTYDAVYTASKIEMIEGLNETGISPSGITTTGSMHATEGMSLGHGSSIYGLDADGNKREAFCACSDSNNARMGYTGYANQDGDSLIYGHDIALYVSNIASPGYFRPYNRRGDTREVTIYTAGYVTNGGKDVYFFVPFTDPILGSPTVTVSSINGFKIRQNGKFTHGSDGSTYKKPSSYSSVLYRKHGISVKASFADITNAVSGDTCGIYWNGQIAFS